MFLLFRPAAGLLFRVRASVARAGHWIKMAGPPNPGCSLANAGHVTDTRSRSTEKERKTPGIIRFGIRFEYDPP